MKTGVLIGNSPFIHNVSTSSLHGSTLIGFNHCPVKVDHVFFYDRVLDKFTGQAHFPIYKPGIQGEPFKPVGADKPVIGRFTKGGIEMLTFKCFTPSIALNWLINRNYEQVFLIGIDHSPDWSHWDRMPHKQPTEDAHAAFKNYVARCAKHMAIYQTNPAVRDSWPLPFMELDQVYAKIKEASQAESHA